MVGGYDRCYLMLCYTTLALDTFTFYILALLAMYTESQERIFCSFGFS